jgi:tRNA(fMet)-specific endonuclease VapC
VSYLLDTNICVAFLNQKDAGLRKRFQQTEPDDIQLCSIVKAELLYGARNGARVEQNLATLAKFFDLFESIAFDDAAAEHYAMLRVHLRRAGTPIGANDLLIASIALATDATLVTRNQDEFHRVPGLRVQAW